MSLSKKYAIGLLGAVIILATLVFLGLFLSKRTKFQGTSPGERPFVSEPSPLPVRREIPGSSEFTNKSFIIALENNATGSIYSPKAQIRGTVASWGVGVITVKVVDKELEISLPQTVEFKCLPLTMTDASGKTYKTTEVWPDLRNAQGVMVEANSIAEKIPVGADITLKVNVGENDKMEASFIVGYGCSI